MRRRLRLFNCDRLFRLFLLRGSSRLNGIWLAQVDADRPSLPNAPLLRLPCYVALAGLLVAAKNSGRPLACAAGAVLTAIPASIHCSPNI